MSVRVLLVDDQPLMLVGLGILVGGTADLEVVGEAGDGREAVRLVRVHWRVRALSQRTDLRNAPHGS
ncbi:hypothetical protein [Kitasatospora sp. NPDC017646]|uniref:hypothetical protein n=1 Tax=Kitasatospora sp. NPDC017646 TaxID=3364024 RepID=UPI0037AAB767